MSRLAAASLLLLSLSAGQSLAAEPFAVPGCPALSVTTEADAATRDAMGAEMAAGFEAAAPILAGALAPLCGRAEFAAVREVRLFGALGAPLPVPFPPEQGVLRVEWAGGLMSDADLQALVERLPRAASGEMPDMQDEP